MRLPKNHKGVDYYEWIRKFEPKTTDDCFTPPEVWDAVEQFVKKEYAFQVMGLTVARPFYPGGDYENEDYRGCVVIDNPPFSQLSKIVRFYCHNNVKFFLFAPALTMCGTAPDCDIMRLWTSADITYANGAKVRTGFLTNLEPGGVRTAVALDAALKQLSVKNAVPGGNPYDDYYWRLDAATGKKVTRREDIEQGLKFHTSVYTTDGWEWYRALQQTYEDIRRRMGRNPRGGGPRRAVDPLEL